MRAAGMRFCHHTYEIHGKGALIRTSKEGGLRFFPDGLKNGCALAEYGLLITRLKYVVWVS